MKSFFQYRTLKLYFFFAKPYLKTSFIITLFLLIGTIALDRSAPLNFIIFAAKIIYYSGVFFYYLDDTVIKELTFYQNFGISKKSLFFSMLIFDCLITIASLILILLV